MHGLEIRETLSPSVMATALIVDMKNFTPNLNAGTDDIHGVNTFCRFLSAFYKDCLDACLTALPVTERSAPELYISSTGDGVLIVFYGEKHVCHGFLAGIILDILLSRRCQQHNQIGNKEVSTPISFGIGIASGKVSRIYLDATTSTGHPVVNTYIGHCINIAARAENITKTLFQANTIIADTTVELVAEEILNKRFDDLRKAECICKDDTKRMQIHQEMNQMNHMLCLSYINRHILKGVEEPMPLYRLARSALKPEIARFENLLLKLTFGDIDRFNSIMAYLNDSAIS